MTETKQAEPFRLLPDGSWTGPSEIAWSEADAAEVRRLAEIEQRGDGFVSSVSLEELRKRLRAGA